MVIHTFILIWKPEATAQQKQRGLDEIHGFAGRIPGLLEVHAGNNFGPRARGYEFGAMMKFTDRAAFEAYVAHPVHEQMLAWAGPLIENAIDFDFEA